MYRLGGRGDQGWSGEAISSRSWYLGVIRCFSPEISRISGLGRNRLQIRLIFRVLDLNEHSPQQAAGYLTLAIQGPLTRASTALIPLSVFLVRAHSAPPSPNLLSPPLFQGSSHPTNIVLPIAPFFPIVLAVTLLALLCSYISARSSRALVLDALRIASVRDPYRIPIPPSRSHIVPLSLLSSPPIPSVLSFLSMPSDILPASLRDNVSPTHNAILALIRLFPPSLPSSFLKKSATP